MKYIFIWLLTIITSKGISFSNMLQMFHDIGNDGYKLDMKKYKEVFGSEGE